MILQLTLKTQAHVDRENQLANATSLSLVERWLAVTHTNRETVLSLLLPLTHLWGSRVGQASGFPRLEMSRLRSTHCSYIGV